MTDDLEKGARGARNGVGVWLMVVALVVAAFALGRLSGRDNPRDDHSPDAFVEDPARRAVVEQQLAEARKVKRWGHEQQSGFLRNLAPLSQKTRGELSRELAGLINTNALMIERDPNPPDPPACPYIPGPCPDASKDGKLGKR